MSTDKARAVLVVGDVKGQFDAAFKKVGAICKKKRQFDMLFCVGDFFGENADGLLPYLSKEKKVPIPTYFILAGDNATELVDDNTNGVRLCENLTFLGRFGVRQFSGLRVAYISGVYNEAAFSKARPMKERARYSESYVAADIQAAFDDVDLLFTSEWPMKLPQQPSPPLASSARRSPIVTELVSKMSPQYHFAGLNDRHMACPIRQSSGIVTRFVGLAAFGSKEKNLYACSVTPSAHLQNRTPAPVEAPRSRYASEQKSSKADEFNRWDFAPPSGYVCHKCDQSGHWIQNCPNQAKKRKPRGDYVCRRCNQPGHFIQDCSLPKPQPGKTSADCWFCLGSPSFKKDLVVSIGEEAYLALPKGPVTDYHFLVLPISCIERLVDAPSSTEADIGRFKEALQNLARKRSQVVIFYERAVRSMRKSHAFTEAVFLPERFVRELPEVVKHEQQAVGINFTPISVDQDLDEAVEDSSYLYIEVPDRLRLVAAVGASTRVPADFLRGVICTLMQEPEKRNWRQCVPSSSDEERLVARMKTVFAEFDPSAASDSESDESDGDSD